MYRDIDPRPDEPERPDLSRGGRGGSDDERPSPGNDSREVFSRDLDLPRGPTREHVRVHSHDYKLRGSEVRVMATAGALRVVPADELRRPEDRPNVLRKDLERLKDLGLVRTMPYVVGRERTTLVTVTERGRSVLEAAQRHREGQPEQTFYAGIAKSRELAHDVRVHRAYLEASGRLIADGHQVRRVVLDHELKREYQTFLQAPNRGRRGSSGRPQRDLIEITRWAEEHHLPMVDDRIQFPDIRIEYDSRDGRREIEDVEVMTPHYRGAHAAAKVSAGFTRYHATGARLGGAQGSKRGGRGRDARLAEDQGVPYIVQRAQGSGWAARKHQLEALERWYVHGWSRLDTRLRSSITEGVVVFLSLFDDNPAVHRAFCPPRSAYMGTLADGEPRPLEPIDTLLDAGRVLALNFPVAMNPGLARIIGVMLKLDFQRAVLQRIPQISAQPDRVWRDLMFVCDEYHAFATVGETDPTGDERTFALSRQARLIPIVATQSISSLRSVLPGDESWRTLLQCFRTKIFLATSDEFTARNAAELCGRKDRMKAHYSLSESGRDAHVSLLTGRAAASKQSITASKSYAPTNEYIFAPRVFTELQNAQAIVLPYDGVNPLPPQFCYLKPHYLDVQTSHFDHLARGVL